MPGNEIKLKAEKKRNLATNFFFLVAVNAQKAVSVSADERLEWKKKAAFTKINSSGCG